MRSLGGGCSSVAKCPTGKQQRLDSETETFIPTKTGGGFDVAAFDWQTGGDMRGIDPRPTAQLQRGQVPAVSFSENQRGDVYEAGAVQSLNKGGGKPGQGYAAIRQASAVRRLTPRECERLQGFPDDYTLITVRGKPAADGPRYKALGNSMAVPVMAWIGERIRLVEQLELAEAA